MAGIFISYRREDGRADAGRIAKELKAQFGEDQIFRDIDTIEPGVNFERAIGQAIGSCAALLAIIGPNWLTVKDLNGRRRLDDPDDYVRLEIKEALARGIRVIPVLVGGTALPNSEELPAAIEPLAKNQVYELSENRWDFDLERLIAALNRVQGIEPKKSYTAGFLSALGAELQRHKGAILAYVLWFFLGGLGVHHFYMGKVRWGLFYIGLLFIGWGLFIAGHEERGFGALTSAGALALIVLTILWLWDLITIPRQLKRRQECIKQELSN